MATVTRPARHSAPARASRRAAARQAGSAAWLTGLVLLVALTPFVLRFGS